MVIDKLARLSQGARDLRRELRGLPLGERRKHHAYQDPPHPGDFIRTEIIEPAGLTVTAAAKANSVRPRKGHNQQRLSRQIELNS
jgi:hypothetical protein